VLRLKIQAFTILLPSSHLAQGLSVFPGAFPEPRGCTYDFNPQHKQGGKFQQFIDIYLLG